MNKFYTILAKHGLFLEQPEPQDQPAGAPGTEEQTALPTTAGEAEAASAPENDIANQQEPQSEIKKLSPESFVWLVTVLKSAFLAHPELEDQKQVAELKGPDGKEVEEINTENAQAVLDLMWPIISKYMPSEAKTSETVDQGVEKLLQKT